MDYFSKFLRTVPQPATSVEVDHAHEFHKSWIAIKDTLLMPDERQLSKGIMATDVPDLLKSMVQSLISESTTTEIGGTGACMEYLLKNDVLGTLVRLSEADRPAGIQAQVLSAVSNMVVFLDEQFLVHSAVHKAVLRLLRSCVGDDIQEQLDGRNKLMGAARNVVRAEPSEYETDLVRLLCILCNRISSYRELLMIFFHDKHWYHSEPLFSVEEGDEYEDDEYDDEEEEEEDPDATLKGIKLEQAAGSDEVRPPSPNSSQATITTHQKVDGKTPEYEFLLFNYLLRFVHREGDIGYFARSGLALLVEVAMSPGKMSNNSTVDQTPSTSDPVNDAALALAEYILDGDFSDVLGAGLNAVYSLLPSKLGFFPHISSGGSNNTMTIGGQTMADEDEKERALILIDKNRAMGIEDAGSPEFAAKIDHFLTHLVFLQNILKRNGENNSVDPSSLVGTAIVQSILDAVRRIFLENVFYPSILECSDADGSAVAVMSYIDIMIRTLQEGPLVNLLVDFLVSEDSTDPQIRQRIPANVKNRDMPPNSSDDKRAKHRRRQSSAMLLLEMEAPESRKETDYFTSMGRYTLKDLLIANLRSKSQPTATSALQLLHTLLKYHPQVAIEKILLVIPDSFATVFPHPAIVGSLRPKVVDTSITEQDEDEEFRYPGAEDSKDASHDSSIFSQPATTYSTHEREMGLYLALVSRIDPSHNRDSDGFSTGYDHYLHDALMTIQSQPDYWRALENEDNAAPRFKHRLNVNDPILSLLLESLTTFFSNSPDFNVGLTGVLATLAIHPDRSMSGWILFASNEDPFASPKPRYSRDTLYDDGDDRSIDFEIEEKLANDTNYLPAASMDEKSKPVIYTILQGLVNQLERYRQTVENFDKYLLERRQGLLFSENLSDALNLELNIVEERKSVKSVEESPAKSKPKPKSTATSSFVSFLTPKKAKVAKAAPQTEPTTPPQQAVRKTVSASPFGSHYHHTGSVKVEPYIAPVPSNGLWTPAKSQKWTIPEDDVFGSGWNERPPKDYDNDEKVAAPAPKLEPITLSQLLDNVVILEESIKELVAIIHARRSLGIDSLRYL
ncbi:Protein FAM160B1 [Psilocybe cubensis]|uniref:FHF complex subunit HOOK-interacting protein C-terminal domain-containing protein n=2 Tax=Psilocybe cubensis TaxID=181762 RepID=A0A8H8CMA2_PSICU|nr:Protein FAM160B1 [Psilocybe cubensis]KAH9484289.1 Protein FAM160B1 [Psilocybe cubensis]